jgi:hypothetical protein
VLEIWDYKGQLRPKEYDERLRDYLFQMMVYADLYRRRHGVYPLRAQLYFLNELEQDRPMETSREEALLTVEYTEEQVEEALSAFRGRVDDIQTARSQDYWPAPTVGHGPGEETCTICDYRWDCPKARNDPGLRNKIPIRYPRIVCGEAHATGSFVNRIGVGCEAVAIVSGRINSAEKLGISKTTGNYIVKRCGDAPGERHGTAAP